MLKIAIPDSVPMLPQCKTSAQRRKGGNGEVWASQEDPISKQTSNKQNKTHQPNKNPKQKTYTQPIEGPLGSVSKQNNGIFKTVVAKQKKPQRESK